MHPYSISHAVILYTDTTEGPFEKEKYLNDYYSDNLSRQIQFLHQSMIKWL